MIGREKTYGEDTRGEQEAAKFLDSFFYPAFAGAGVRRETDQRNQWRGVDVRIGRFSIDEKFKLRDVNRQLRWLGLEVAFENRAGERQEGWLCRQDSLTDIYAFVQLSSESSRYTQADVIWVAKKDIEEELNGQGLDIAGLTGQAARLVDGAESGRIKTDKRGIARMRYGAGARFCLSYSTLLPERPVNLVFETSTLASLPNSRRFSVNEQGVRRA